MRLKRPFCFNFYLSWKSVEKIENSQKIWIHEFGRVARGSSESSFTAARPCRLVIGTVWLYTLKYNNGFDRRMVVSLTPPLRISKTSREPEFQGRQNRRKGCFKLVEEVAGSQGQPETDKVDELGNGKGVTGSHTTPPCIGKTMGETWANEGASASF